MSNNCIHAYSPNILPASHHPYEDPIDNLVTIKNRHQFIYLSQNLSQFILIPYTGTIIAKNIQNADDGHLIWYFSI